MVTNKQHLLEFTGNWFFDIGILGFINLMEEVYGWDLEKLENRLKQDYNKTIYEYFINAYLIKHSIILKKEKEKNNLIKKIKEKISKLNEEKIKLKEKNKKTSKKQEKLQKELNEIYAKLKQIEISKIQEIKQFFNGNTNNFKLNSPSYSKNFWIFNSKANERYDISKNYLYFLLKEDLQNIRKVKAKISKKNELSYEIYFDKTVNPFLFSNEKFSNINYCINEIFKNRYIKLNRRLSLPIYLIMLCFYLAFNNINSKNIVFYSPDIEFTYLTNKKIKKLLENLENYNNKKINILEITWKSVIDTLIEYKSQFALENMYIIEFSKIKDQQIKGVEYIGMNKVQATILLDEEIRSNINKNLMVSDKECVWILENFLKNEDLFYIIIKHFKVSLANNWQISLNACLYILSILIALDDLNETKKSSPFYFNPKKIKLKNIVKNIKNNKKELRYINRKFTTIEGVDKYILPLFSAIKKNDKQKFLNLLSKFLLQQNSLDKSIINYLNNYIIFNNKTWKYFALGMILKNIEK